MKKRGIVLALAFMLAASLGFSQDTGTGTANAGAAANVNIVNSSSNEGRQLLQAMPGSGMTVIPGMTMGNTPWLVYFSKTEPCILVSQLMAAPKASHVKIDLYMWLPPINRDGVSDLNDRVCIVNWWPDNFSYPGDQKIADETITGKNRQPEMAAFITGLQVLVKKTGTRRVAVRRRSLEILHTGAFTFGVGGNGSATTNGNIGGSGAGGIGGGHSNTGNEDPLELEMYALNDNRQFPLLIPTQPDTTQEQPEQPVKPEAIVAPPQPLPAPPPASAAPAAAPTTTSAPTTPTPAVTAPCTTCTLPEFVAYFDYAKSDIKSEYLSDLDKAGTWLKSHADCNVVIEGHTDKSGGVVYNDGLGARRSLGVYNYFIKHGVSPKQIRYDSFGKHEATREHYQPDRKVVLHVEGASSDPNAPINPAK